MCYMESKMQEQYDAADARANDLFEEMDKFEAWVKLSIPYANKALLDDKLNVFDYTNETISLIWQGWKAKAGL